MKETWAGKIVVSFTGESKEIIKRVIEGVESVVEEDGGKIVKYASFYGEGTGSSGKLDDVAIGPE